MIKKYALILGIGLSVFCLGACGKKAVNNEDDKTESVMEAETDSDGLESYVAEYEKDYGKINKSNISDYLDDLQIAVLSKRDYGVQSIDRFGNTLVFDFTDGSSYKYTPTGFDEYDPDAEYESESEAPIGYADMPNVGTTVQFADEAVSGN